MAFATVQEFANHMQATVTTSAATSALNTATSRIQSATGQDFVLVEDDEITLRGGAGWIRLPQRPVIEVSSVVTQFLGDSATTTQAVNVEYTRWGDELTWIAGGYSRLGASPRWPYMYWDWPEFVTVTYTHGYAVIPDDVKGTCLDLAAEIYSSPDGSGYESIEDYAVRRDNAERTPATLALKALVRRYGTRSASVQLR